MTEPECLKVMARGADRIAQWRVADYAGNFFGRPPLAPLARAAAALASDFTFPPRRPSETAAGFLRGNALAADGLGAVRVGEHDLAVDEVAGGAAAVGVPNGFGGGEERLAGGFGGVHVQSMRPSAWVVNREESQ